ncbi:hypothetical protein L1987_59442 [Smallanthus sonchifolius]|uniref:Uncharacterized protein n=1 Tax=Smallanthus sonchifolius TaxID=185202 RepID=A0ACB9D5G4_9ASTR|nr:hypothetical protein L1987_59442 [Smallanthus sonchifolius]
MTNFGEKLEPPPSLATIVTPSAHFQSPLICLSPISPHLLTAGQIYQRIRAPPEELGRGIKGTDLTNKDADLVLVLRAEKSGRDCAGVGCDGEDEGLEEVDGGGSAEMPRKSTGEERRLTNRNFKDRDVGNLCGRYNLKLSCEDILLIATPLKG